MMPIRTVTLSEYQSLDIAVSVDGHDATATIDCGCTSILISETYVKQNQIPT